MMKLIILIFLLSVFCANSKTVYAQKVKEYQLEVEVEPSERFLKGKAEVLFESLKDEAVNFYLHGELKVDSIKYNNNIIAFDTNKEFYAYSYSLIAGNTSLSLPQNFDDRPLTIYYSGYFNSSQNRSPSDYMRISEEGVFLRSYGYSLWFPVFLTSGSDAYQVDFSSVSLKTPKKYVSIFTGNLVDEDIDSTYRTTKWKAKNTSLFEAQFTARPYKLEKSEGVTFYLVSNTEDPTWVDSLVTFTQTVRSFYYDKYGNSQDSKIVHVMEMPKFGDISSGNVIGISEDKLNTQRRIEFTKRVIAHELVHDFVAIPVGVDSEYYSFVVEGFPNYFNLLALEKIMGNTWYKNRILRIHELYLKRREASKKEGTNLPVEKPILSIFADELPVYKDTFVLNDRAILFLHELRNRMSSERFFEFSKILFSLDEFGHSQFANLISRYLDDSESLLKYWLESTAYQEEYYPNFLE